MSVTGLSVEAEASPVATKRATSRTRPIVLLVILFALLAGVYAYLANYQPLYAPDAAQSSRPGAVVWPAPGTTLTRAQAARVQRLTGQSADAVVYFVSPKPGTTFGFGNPIASNGLIPVKIVDVQTSFIDGKTEILSPVRLADQRPVTISPKELSTYGGRLSGVAPFAPYWLSSHTKQLPTIGVAFTIPKCATQQHHYGPNNVLWAETYSVTYKYLWFTHKVMILGVPPYLAVVAPNDCGSAAK
jgi:hypothetical protein